MSDTPVDSCKAIEAHEDLKPIEKLLPGPDQGALEHFVACTESIAETVPLMSSLDLDPTEEYKMDNRRRGLALIFNMMTFEGPQRVRDGTDIDRDTLKRKLKKLDFEVKTYNDCKTAQVLTEISNAAKKDHSDADCFLLVFLSHGKKDYVSTYDGEIGIRDITEQFKEDRCRSLAGKPKIFIFQACRGKIYDDPVSPCAVSGTEQEMEEEVVEEAAIHTVNAGPDSIMCYSVAEDYYSHRNIHTGTWFIQDLCKLLQKGGSLEFTKLLTKVNREVSMRSSHEDKKQAPCFVSMLTKKLHFRPKESSISSSQDPPCCCSAILSWCSACICPSQT